MSAHLRPITVAGTTLERYFHVCAFFDSREQEYSVLGSFYEEGLSGGERALHVVDRSLCDDHRRRLAELGIDVRGLEKSGQLQLATAEDTYLAGGVFDPDLMLGRAYGGLASGKERGFPRTRFMGKMDWAFRGAPGSNRLIEYEARVNDLLAKAQQPAICVYDTSRLTGGMVLDILRCHPLTLMNGMLHENPLYTPPDVFVAELRHRACWTPFS